METSTSYIIAGVSLAGLCLIRICIRKIRSYFTSTIEIQGSDKLHSSDLGLTNSKNNEKYPTYI